MTYFGRISSQFIFSIVMATRVHTTVVESKSIAIKPRNLCSSQKNDQIQSITIMAEDNSWVFDSLVCFLHGPIWNASLQTFIEEKSLSKYIFFSLFSKHILILIFLCFTSDLCIIYYNFNLGTYMYVIFLVNFYSSSITVLTFLSLSRIVTSTALVLFYS